MRRQTLSRPTRPAARLAALSLAAACLVGATATTLAAPAGAATSSACSTSGFTVTMPDGTVAPSKGARASTAALPADARIKVRGTYVEFDVAPVTGAVYDYVYTGAANRLSMTPGVRTPVMAAKTLDLGPVLRSDVDVRTDKGDLVLISRGGGAKVKVQAKDCATGGIFQQEVEAARAVTATHTLAPGMHYYVNPYTGKINFGNDTLFRGKDSAQVATKLSQTETTTTWSIAPGGRMGQVLGEDAVELSAGPTVCVSDCQARNRVRGSLPVTDPAFS
ncbi:hypothetical protein [Pseudokineococcus lusitanus]|uniref:Uncharacterized protein n=1 Tax=Pseudokineococcus lusitanus TaxID=763993 RepID=A0A3N1GAH2_9ACTN|nr:hypothetical protein [Pseudokineococcus lusitanus]ROP27236.1 hypothetical protein EDC03_2760 [Pseudokineococcus lusitanus]